MIYGYTRVSTIEQSNGTSLDEQRRKIEGVALMRGEAVDAVFTDAGVSGSVALSQRPDGGRLVAKLQPGDTVIVAKLDRIFRSAADALQMVDQFKNSGIDLVIADIGADAVTQNGTSKMFFGILALVAEFERDRIKERQREGQAAKKRVMGFSGGKRPFGYDVQGTGKDAVLIPNEKEQDAIKDMKELQAAGHSLRAIASRMNERGFTVSHMAVKSVLSRT